MTEAKILMVGTSYWLSPSHTFVAHHALGLKKWHPTVLSAVRINDAWSDRLPVTSVAGRVVSLPSLLFTMLGRSAAAEGLVAESRPRLAHVHFLTAAVTMLPFLERARLPFVATAHGYDATMTRFRNPLVGWLMRNRLQEVFDKAERILCVSDYIRDCVIERGCPPAKAVTHYLGIPVPPLRGLPRAPGRIVFVGRLVPKKGLLTLLDACAMLRERGVSFSLHVIGDGPQRAEAQEKARLLGLNVEWLGVQPHARVLEEMEQATLFCMPSSRAPDGDNEGLPITYLEAQALQTPVVGFDQGGLREAIANGETGLLAPDRDVDALAAALAAVLADPGLAERLGKAGRARILERFSIDRQTERLEALYDEIASRQVER